MYFYNLLNKLKTEKLTVISENFWKAKSGVSFI